MAWQIGVTRLTADIVTAAQWNGYLGAGGDFDILFDGTKILADLVRESSLAIGNAPIEGARLVARAAETGGMKWIGPADEALYWIGG